MRLCRSGSSCLRPREADPEVVFVAVGSSKRRWGDLSVEEEAGVVSRLVCVLEPESTSTQLRVTVSAQCRPACSVSGISCILAYHLDSVMRLQIHSKHTLLTGLQMVIYNVAHYMQHCPFTSPQVPSHTHHNLFSYQRSLTTGSAYALLSRMMQTVVEEEEAQNG